MPKGYEYLPDDELEDMLDSDGLSDEDARRILHILEDRASRKLSPIHEEREQEEEV